MIGCVKSYQLVLREFHPVHKRFSFSSSRPLSETNSTNLFLYPIEIESSLNTDLNFTMCFRQS